MSNTGTATYGTTLIEWTASTTSTALKVTIKIGGSTAAEMNFTPNTLTHNLSYENADQTASGLFTVQFSADGKAGKLSCTDYIWEIGTDKGGPVSALVGTWDLSS